MWETFVETQIGRGAVGGDSLRNSKESAKIQVFAKSKKNKIYITLLDYELISRNENK
jgi:hypothetical protein